jgi:hypothetical protein
MFNKEERAEARRKRAISGFEAEERNIAYEIREIRAEVKKAGDIYAKKLERYLAKMDRVLQRQKDLQSRIEKSGLMKPEGAPICQAIAEGIIEDGHTHHCCLTEAEHRTGNRYGTPHRCGEEGCNVAFVLMPEKHTGAKFHPEVAKPGVPHAYSGYCQPDETDGSCQTPHHVHEGFGP